MIGETTYKITVSRADPDNNGWNFVYLMYKFWIIGHIIATLLAFIWAWN